MVKFDLTFDRYNSPKIKLKARFKFSSSNLEYPINYNFLNID